MTASMSLPIPQWLPFSRTMIDDPTLSILFGGLLAFCFNENSYECEVGVHNSSDHFLNIKVWRNDQEKPIFTWTGHAATVKNDSYSVRGSANLPSVHFFQPAENFERQSANEHDWRFILDLESPEFYGFPTGRRTLTRRSNILKPRLRIDTGLFYAAKLSHCDYRRQHLDGSGYLFLGKIAASLGVNIRLNGSDYVDVALPGGFNRRITAGTGYTIRFENNCLSLDCDDPNSSDPEVQNDFHHHNATFVKPAGQELLYLVRDSLACTEPGPNMDLLDKVGASLKAASDRAPCASAGFGTGGGLGG